MRKRRRENGGKKQKRERVVSHFICFQEDRKKGKARERTGSRPVC